MSEEKQQLHQKLWDIANELRGNMNGDEFKNYILGFIFYKFLSEKIELTLNQQLENDHKTFKDAYAEETYKIPLKQTSIKKLGYFIEPQYLFHNLIEDIKNKKDILLELGEALNYIESSTQGTDSYKDFDDLFEDVDLTSSKLGKTPKQKNELVSKILIHLNDIDFKLEDSNIDVLGDAYEYLIAQFASGAGKKAGEFYTPQQVSEILASIVTMGKDRISSVYDPTCGSGSLLLRVSKQCKVDYYYGQELNQTTYNLARMNMVLHNIRHSDFFIEQGDTLEEPLHLDKTFEAVVANPPFSANWSAADKFKEDDRFSKYGKLAPKTKADFAFVQHMIHHLDENGTMAIVLPHGVLFRGAAEGVIRKFLIDDKNYLDTVIGLPANIFFGTGIPTCILVFKKNRKNKKNVLFIDASNNFEKVKNQNKLREKDIDLILSTYKNREEIEKYSHLATQKEISENDYNLNIPRYVDTFEEEEPIDLNQVVKELRALEDEIKEIDQTIIDNCKELGIEAPIFTGNK